MIRRTQFRKILWIGFMYFVPILSFAQSHSLFDSLYRKNSVLVEIDTLKKFAIYQLQLGKIKGRARLDWYSAGRCETISIYESDSTIFKEETNFYAHPLGDLNEITPVSKRYVYYPNNDYQRFIKTFFFDYNGKQKHVVILEIEQEENVEIDFENEIIYWPGTKNSYNDLLEDHYQKMSEFMKRYGYVVDYKEVRSHIYDSKRYFDFLSVAGCSIQLNGERLSFNDSLFVDNRAFSVFDILNRLYNELFSERIHTKEAHFLFEYSY